MDKTNTSTTLLAFHTFFQYAAINGRIQSQENNSLSCALLDSMHCASMRVHLHNIGTFVTTYAEDVLLQIKVMCNHVRDMIRHMIQCYNPNFVFWWKQASQRQMNSVPSPPYIHHTHINWYVLWISSDYPRTTVISLPIFTCKNSKLLLSLCNKHS